MYYSVKEVADMYHISPHALRYYTDQELIPGIERDGNNRRLFNKVALGWLRTIIAFRSTGMSVKMIKKYIELYKQGERTIPERYELVVKQQQITQEKISELMVQLEIINEKVNTYYDWINKSIEKPNLNK